MDTAYEKAILVVAEDQPSSPASQMPGLEERLDREYRSQIVFLGLEILQDPLTFIEMLDVEDKEQFLQFASKQALLGREMIALEIAEKLMEKLVPRIEVLDTSFDEVLDLRKLFAVGLLSTNPNMSLDEVYAAIETLLREFDTINYIATFGLDMELEVHASHNVLTSDGRERLVEWCRRYDMLQLIGIPVGYGAVRELKLPHSHNRTPQVISEALKILESLGIIHENLDHAIHLYIGGFSNPIAHIKEFIGMHLLLNAAGLFGTLPRNSFYSELKMPPQAQKKLTDTTSTLPDIGVIRIKNDSLLELRAVFYEWFNAETFEKAYTIFGNVGEALVHKTEDLELREIWDHLMEEFYNICDEHVNIDFEGGIRGYVENVGKIMHYFTLMQPNQSEVYSLGSTLLSQQENLILDSQKEMLKYFLLNSPTSISEQILSKLDTNLRERFIQIQAGGIIDWSMIDNTMLNSFTLAFQLSMSAYVENSFSKVWGSVVEMSRRKWFRDLNMRILENSSDVIADAKSRQVTKES